MFQIAQRSAATHRPQEAGGKVVPFPRRAVHPQPEAAPNWANITPLPRWQGEPEWADKGYAEIAKACDLRAVLGL